VELDPTTLPWTSVYKILIGSVVPRPIGWISTVNPAGQPNLAPFSFFNVACANPPHVLFCPMVRSTDGQPKDTLRNVRQSGEFVANIATEALAQAVNLSSTEFPPEINEFEAAGLTAEPSAAVRPPRVAESPIHLECVLHQIVDLGTQPGGGSVVIGRVVHLHVRDEVLIPPDKIDLARLQPIARQAGNSYARVTDTLICPGGLTNRSDPMPRQYIGMAHTH
jgi:flavin reductase (DIM6/NTAB) family NADH-FMN oxidoreductase RutF